VHAAASMVNEMWTKESKQNKFEERKMENRRSVARLLHSLFVGLAAGWLRFVSRF
jgi:hypothetical protein